jgi:hypothetical protein
MLVEERIARIGFCTTLDRTWGSHTVMSQPNSFFSHFPTFPLSHYNHVLLKFRTLFTCIVDFNRLFIVSLTLGLCLVLSAAGDGFLRTGPLILTFCLSSLGTGPLIWLPASSFTDIDLNIRDVILSNRA